MTNCFKCKNECTLKEEKGNLFGYPCDFCRNMVCSSCAGTSASEVRVLILKTRSLFHLCPECRENIFKNILELNQKVSFLEEELKKVKRNGPDFMEKRVKSIEDVVKEIKLANQDDKLVDLKKKIKNIEEKVAKTASKNVEASQYESLEGTVTKVLKETLKYHTKEVSDQIKTLSSCVRDENAKVIRLISSSMGEANTQHTNAEPNINNVDPGIVNSQTGATIGHENLVVPSSSGRTEGKSQGKTNIVSKTDISAALLEVQSRNKLNSIIHIEDDNESLHGVSHPQSSKTLSIAEARTSKDAVRGSGTKDFLIAAAEERKWYFVNNLDVNTKEEQLRQHLTHFKISVLSCEKIKKNGHSTSFKIAVKPSDENVILNEKIWPKSVTVRPFIFNWDLNSGRDGRRDYQSNFRRKGNTYRRY